MNQEETTFEDIEDEIDFESYLEEVLEAEEYLPHQEDSFLVMICREKGIPNQLVKIELHAMGVEEDDYHGVYSAVSRILTRREHVEKYLCMPEMEKSCVICGLDNPNFQGKEDLISSYAPCDGCGAEGEFYEGSRRYMMRVDDFKWFLDSEELLDKALVKKTGEHQREVFACYKQLLDGDESESLMKRFEELEKVYSNKHNKRPR